MQADGAVVIEDFSALDPLIQIVQEPFEISLQRTVKPYLRHCPLAAGLESRQRFPIEDYARETVMQSAPNRNLDGGFIGLVGFGGEHSWKAERDGQSEQGGNATTTKPTPARAGARLGVGCGACRAQR
ncbi:MAG: hypothetical protein O3A94_07600 [Proteobacteria bacterium]|nr:hypothetical protein [Pseudomonadota bacterium]